MIRKQIFCVALASLTMATSCSQDNLLSPSKSSENEISFHASMGLKSRATETTIKNLGSFYVSAFKDKKEGETDVKNYMTNVKYSSTDEGSTWKNEGGTYFWPAEDALNFYAYAPEKPGSAGTMNLSESAQQFTDFSPNTSAEEQKDFVYTSTAGSYAANKADGVSLTFKHALSWIDIKAKNSNKAYTIKITDVKLGNIINKGTFTFPKAGESSSEASWTTSSENTDKAAYTTTVTSTTLAEDGTVSAQLGGNFMVIPQTLNKQSQASSGTYIAAKVTVQMQGSQKYAEDKWVYVGIGGTNTPTSWAKGTHYTYTLDFSNGLGQDEDGNCIFNSNEIALSAEVTAWDEANQYPIISIVPTSANSVLMSTTQVYAIDIATKPNAFWTSDAAGDSKLTSAPIADDTEWTAEVVWQDIQSRAIDFCDNSGTTQTTDTYTGKGKTLYVKSRGTAVGNIVVGIKKNGASNDDGYLWSWHLWIAEDPLEINGFMDRNLGATKAFPTTNNALTDFDESYGCFYQFGRKDAMPHRPHYYKIDGTENTTWNTAENTRSDYKHYGQVTLAQCVQNPTPFYCDKSGEWVSNNSYTNYYWNDINKTNSGTTKTFFDPCPDGWRLPVDEELKVLEGDKFVWDATNKGRWYGSNWFPVPGYLHCKGVSEDTFQWNGTSGYLWSAQYTTTSTESGATPANRGNGFYFWGDSNKGLSDTNRADGVKVRCVRDKSN